MPDWQPIENCPEDIQKALGLDSDGEMEVMHRSVVNPGNWVIWDGERVFRPTHFALLPEPPK